MVDHRAAGENRVKPYWLERWEEQMLWQDRIERIGWIALAVLAAIVGGVSAWWLTMRYGGFWV